eukprot:TRINITY_DN192_c1_g1_i1.p1 TRINITY_DN192_c1_g1~~TRINITY_DN192_c1_g1_i1.p1  ORF type:complete len:290 (+),score=149.20 TRINITY_DN192_c1_g1_i1:213-1082(+)
MNHMQGWFVEKCNLWPGQAMALEVEKVIYQGRSKFQDVLVVKTSHYGNVLVLDGAIQITDRDEFAYQEMIAHIPLFAHPNPQRVCVIGGGDGAVLSQILKHKSVVEARLCEIDEDVIKVSKQNFPKFAHVWDHPKVTVQIGDGLEYIRNLSEPTFDVVIVDSSDPDGPASTLFGLEFYKSVFKALKPGGILCAQSECIWLHLNLIKSLGEAARTVFPIVEYAYTTIPTYPSGQIGFLVCNKEETSKLPKRTVNEALIETEIESLQYYTSEIHPSSFILPNFAKKQLTFN